MDKKSDTGIPNEISSRSEYKRKFNLREMYQAFIYVPGALAKLIDNKKKEIIKEDFIERLHLAVTEVNGCAVCSYAHAQMALEKGMSNEEINSFLSGDGRFINQEESKAIVFSQHYADTRGLPKKEAYQSIIDEYGEEKTEIIISAIQLIMAGNIFGIPYSAFKSRLKGKKYKDSSLTYELKMLSVGLIITPIALIHGGLKSLIGLSNIRFD
ncbi:MAG: carboxymuconolactone decarboxylase family protein [Bacillota bacterium]